MIVHSRWYLEQHVDEPDGAHASYEGSNHAAKTIWMIIEADLEEKQGKEARPVS